MTNLQVVVSLIMKDNFKIGNYGIFCTMVVTIIGINIFSYPRIVTSIAETEGWIITILTSLIVMFLLSLVYKTIKLNKFKTFSEIVKDNFGVVLGKVILLFFAIYNIIFTAYALRIFVEVLKMHLLEKTPSEIIIILLIIVSLFLVRGGINSVIKFNEIIFFIVFIPLTVTLFLTLNNADLTNVLPIFNNSPKTYVSGTFEILFYFIGANISYMIVPYAKNRVTVKKTLVMSQIFVAIAYITVTIIALGIFGKTEVKSLIWPTVSSIKTIEIPGSFIERWEGIVMVFWILFFFINFVNMYLFSSQLTNEILNLKDVRFTAVILASIFYIVSLSKENIAQIYEVNEKNIYIISGMIIFIFPIILYLLTKYKNRRVNKVEKES